MKRTKLVALLGMVALLASCGGQTSTPTSAEDTGAATTPSTTIETTLKIGSPSTQSEFVKGQVEKFLKDNGYSKVTVSMVELGEDKADSNITDWTTGPDVYAFAGDKILSLNQQGALATVPNSKLRKMGTDLSSEAFSAATLGTSTVAYPFAADNGYFMYYDSSVVKHTGSIDEVIADCAAAGRKVVYSLDTAWYSIGLLTSFGSRYNVNLAADGSKISSITADFDSANGVKAAKAMLQLVNNPNVDVVEADNGTAPSAANKVGATITGTWNGEAFATAVGENLKACKLPSITVDGTLANIGSFAGYKLYGVNPKPSGKDTARLDLAHSVAEYLISEAAQAARFEAFKTAPTNKTVAAKEEVTSDIGLAALAAQAPYSIPQTAVPGNIWSAANTLRTTMKDTPVMTDAQLEEAMKAFNTTVCKVDN